MFSTIFKPNSKATLAMLFFVFKNSDFGTYIPIMERKKERKKKKVVSPENVQNWSKATTRTLQNTLQKCVIFAHFRTPPGAKQYLERFKTRSKNI